MHLFLRRSIALTLIFSLAQDGARAYSGSGAVKSRIRDPKSAIFVEQALQVRDIFTVNPAPRAEAVDLFRHAPVPSRASAANPAQTEAQVVLILGQVSGLPRDGKAQKAFDLIAPLLENGGFLKPEFLYAALPDLYWCTRERQQKGTLSVQDVLGVFQKCEAQVRRWIEEKEKDRQPADDELIVLTKVLHLEALIQMNQGESEDIRTSVDLIEKAGKLLPAAEHLSPARRDMLRQVSTALRRLSGQAHMNLFEFDADPAALRHAVADFREGNPVLETTDTIGASAEEKAFCYFMHAEAAWRLSRLYPDDPERESWLRDARDNIHRADRWLADAAPGLAIDFLKEHIPATLQEIETILPGLPVTASAPHDDVAIRELQEKLKRDPQSCDLHYRLAAVLDKKERYEEAIPHYQQALSALWRWPADLQRGLTMPWKNPDPEKALEEMQQSRPLFARLHDKLEAMPEIIPAVACIYNRLGHAWEALRPTHSAEAIAQSRNYFMASNWISGNLVTVSVDTRIDTWLSLSRVLIAHRDYREALEYAEKAQKTSHMLLMLLNHQQITETIVSSSENRTLRQDLATSLQYFLATEADSHFRAGSALSLLEQWQASDDHFREALQLGLSPDLKARARLMVGWGHYYQVRRKAEAGPEEEATARAILEEMKKIPRTAAPSDATFEADALTKMALAKQQEWSGDSEAALQGLAAGYAAIIGIPLGDEVTDPGLILTFILENIETDRVRLGKNQLCLAMARQFLREIAHLARRLGQSQPADAIDQSVSRFSLERPPAPAKAPTPNTQEETEAANPAKSSEEALAALEKMIRGPVPYDATIERRINAVFDAFSPLARYQDILDALAPVIGWLERPWDVNKSTDGVFALAWVYYLRAISFTDLNRLADAIGSVKCGYAQLEIIKDACRQRSLMVNWQARKNVLQTAHGKALRFRYEATKDEPALREALDLLTTAVAGLSGKLGQESSRKVHADLYANLGWVQYYLYETEKTSHASDQYLKKAEENAALALKASAEDKDAIQLRDRIAQTRARLASVQKEQRERLASIDAKLISKDFQAASQELDRLEQTGWPPLRVVYYRGLIEYQAARNAENPEAALAHDQRAVEIWSAHPAEKLAGAWDTEDKAREVRYTLIESQLRAGHLREAVALAMSDVDHEPKDTVLAQRWVDILPNAESYAVIAEALALRQPSSAADAFGRQLESLLTQKQPSPEWQEEALSALRELTSPDNAFQKQAEQAWTSIGKNDLKLLDKFFTRDPWKSLSPERKARLLLQWAPEFLISGKFKERILAITRFIEETRATVEALMKKKGNQIRVMEAEETLKNLRSTLVTGLPAMLKETFGITLSSSNYPGIVGAVRALDKVIEQALGICGLQILEKGFERVERSLAQLTQTSDEALIAAPEQAQSELDKTEKTLLGLRERISPPPVGKASSDRHHGLVRQIEEQQHRITAARWLHLQRQIEQLPNEATDEALAALAVALDVLRATLKSEAMKPQPADLPDQVTQSLDRARHRVADYRISQERERVARDRAAFEENVRRFNAARQAILTDTWNALEHDLGGLRTPEDELRLPELRTRMIALEAASRAVLELTGRPAAFEALYRAAVLRIERNKEMASRFNEIMEHPITQALIPKDLVPRTFDETLDLIAAALNVPALDQAIHEHYLTWLKAANETEWIAQGLDTETGYAISRAAYERVRQPTKASKTPDLAVRRNLLDQAHVRLLKLNRSTTKIRQSETTELFTSPFELYSNRIVQCEFDTANLPRVNGNAHPILLRLGPGAAKAGPSPIRIAVFLPTPFRGIPEDRAAAALLINLATRTALLMGLGFGQAEATVVAQIHEHRQTSFDHYRLRNPAPESHERLDQYRLEHDPEAPRRTLLAIGLAESETGGTLAAITSAAADARGERNGDALAQARFDFIHKYLAAWPTDNDSPAAASNAVTALGAIVDAWLSAVGEAAVRYGKDVDVVSALRTEWAPMHRRRQDASEIERKAELARQAETKKKGIADAGVPPLIESLRVFLMEDSTADTVRDWIQRMEIVMATMEETPLAAGFAEVRQSLIQITEAIDAAKSAGATDGIWWALYRQLIVLNFYLFAPAAGHWFWLDYDSLNRPLNGSLLNKTAVVHYMPLSAGDGFTFVLTPDVQEPGYWHDQHMTLLSIQEIRKRFRSALAQFPSRDILKLREFERRFVERQVFDHLAGGADALIMRSTSQAAVTWPSQDMRRLRPTEAEVLEIAREFRRLITANGPDEIRSQLESLLAGLQRHDRVGTFVWTQAMNRMRVNPQWQERGISQFLSVYNRQGKEEATRQLKALMALHLNLPPDGDVSSELYASGLLDEVFKAMELDAAPSKNGEPVNRAASFRDDTTGQEVGEYALILGAVAAFAGIVFAGTHFGALAHLHLASLPQIASIAIGSLLLGGYTLPQRKKQLDLQALINELKQSMLPARFDDLIQAVKIFVNELNSDQIQLLRSCAEGKTPRNIAQNPSLEEPVKMMLKNLETLVEKAFASFIEVPVTLQLVAGLYFLEPRARQESRSAEAA